MIEDKILIIQMITTGVTIGVILGVITLYSIFYVVTLIADWFIKLIFKDNNET